MRSSISVPKRNGFLAAFLGFWILSLLAEYFLLPKRFLLTDICPLAEETYTVVAGHSGYPAAPARKTLSPEDSEALQKELFRLRLRTAHPEESEIIPAGNSYYLEF